MLTEKFCKDPILSALDTWIQGPRNLLFARLTKMVIWNDSDKDEYGTIS